MTTDEMLRTTKKFAIDWGHLVLSLEVNAVNRAYGGRLIRSGSPVGANTATRRARSTSDFINKFKIVEEEMNESLFFPETIQNLIKIKGKNRNFIQGGGKRSIVASLKTVRK